jgi:hypothetical protein
LGVTQQGRIAELETLLSHRIPYKNLSDKALSRLAKVIVQPEQPLIKAAGVNLLLRDLLKRWQSLCGTVQFLRKNGGKLAPIAAYGFNAAEKGL